MPWRAYYKRKLAAPGRLDSKALRADAAEAVSCAYLAGVLIVGLLLSRLLGWWWLGSVAAIALVPFIVIEAHEATSEDDATGDPWPGPPSIHHLGVKNAAEASDRLFKVTW